MVVVCAAGCTAGSKPAVAPVTTATSATVTAPSPAASLVEPSSDPTTTASPTLSNDPPARLADAIDGVVDVAALAELLSANTLTMQDITATADARASAGALQQLALRWLAERPELDEQVLAALDTRAVAPIRRTIEARQFAAAVRASRTDPPPPVDDLPVWTIVEPEPVETLLDYYSQAEAATGVAWYWLAAIHLQETRLGRIVGVSSAGAMGPMQFLPSTWQECCTGDPSNTRDAIMGAATYLALSGAPGDMRAAVYQYNPNVSYVVAVTATAENLRDAPELFAGYHGWQVFYATSEGDVRLPVGYQRSTPITAAEFLRENPEHRAD
jgi:hypothetical protein